MKHTGGKGGGACVAAAFLNKFVSYPWVHLDVAGLVSSETEKAIYSTMGNWPGCPDYYPIPQGLGRKIGWHFYGEIQINLKRLVVFYYQSSQWLA